MDTQFVKPGMYIDFRSDTVTKPTGEMRQAMAESVVGDDVYGDDPTIARLEEAGAKALGLPAALFVPSGTMGNQIAVMTHTKRGDEVILGSNAHIAVHEVGAAAVLSGVSYRMVDNPDETVRGQDVVKAIRPEDIHYPDTGLLCLENPLSNGRVVPLNIMEEAYLAASKNKIPVHLDGARIFNAAAYLGVKASDIAKFADSVMFCLSKGLCSPVGSILAGSTEFVNKARKYRKMLGGGMRQAGVLAACGIISIEKMTKRLPEDHDNARYLAERLDEIDFIKSNEVHINMVFFRINKPSFDHKAFTNALLEKGIKSNAGEGGLYRFVTHNDISRKDIDLAIDAIREIL